MNTAKKLDTLVIPELTFENCPLPFVLDYLRLQTYRLDDEETVPGRRGVQIAYLLPDEAANALLLSLSFHDCDLRTALAHIAYHAGLSFFANSAGAYLWLPDGACAAPEPEPIIPGLPTSQEVAAEEHARARAASEARALALWPAINDASTPESQELGRLYAQYADDPLVQSDNAAYFLALAAVVHVRSRRPNRLRSTILAIKAAWACLRWNLAARVPSEAGKPPDGR